MLPFFGKLDNDGVPQHFAGLSCEVERPGVFRRPNSVLCMALRIFFWPAGLSHASLPTVGFLFKGWFRLSSQSVNVAVLEDSTPFVCIIVQLGWRMGDAPRRFKASGLVRGGPSSFRFLQSEQDATSYRDPKDHRNMRILHSGSQAHKIHTGYQNHVLEALYSYLVFGPLSNVFLQDAPTAQAFWQTTCFFSSTPC